MDIEELKEWMDERFTRNEKDHTEIKESLISTNKKVTSHDRWLWMIRGIGAAGLALLGLLGYKATT